jgi:hypothetical protein
MANKTLDDFLSDVQQDAIHIFGTLGQKPVTTENMNEYNQALKDAREMTRDAIAKEWIGEQ